MSSTVPRFDFMWLIDSQKHVVNNRNADVKGQGRFSSKALCMSVGLPPWLRCLCKDCISCCCCCCCTSVCVRLQCSAKGRLCIDLMCVFCV
jgi:hypothetical protein